MSHERKQEEQKQKLKKLQIAWQDRGAVKFDEQFHDVSDKIMGQLKKTIKKFESDYMTPYNGTIPQVSNKTYHMQKVSATEVAKLLLLSSGNNQLAEEIKITWKSNMMRVLCERLTETQIWLRYSRFFPKLIIRYQFLSIKFNTSKC